MIYIWIICLPIILSYLADKTRGALNLVFAAAAMFVPCFFAAVRNYTVGTDILVYGVYTYRAASTQSLFDFMRAYRSISAPGFNLVAWFFSQFGSMAVFLGGVQALTICPFYLYVRHRWRYCTWPATAAYMLLLFPISLNAMKQMIAASLYIVAYSFIDNKKPIRYIVYTLCITVLFHETAAITIFFYPVMKLLSSANDTNAFFGRAQRAVAWVTVLVSLGFLVIFGDELIKIISPIKESYSYQANAQGTRLVYSALVMTGILIVSHAFYQSQNKDSLIDQSDDVSDFYSLSVIGSLMFQLNVVADSLMRFAYYGISFIPLYVSGLISKKNLSSSVAAGLILIFLIFYFVQVYVINGGNAVFPYTSTILGVE